MNGKTLLPDPSLIKLERFISSPDVMTIVVKTKQPQAFCSLCQQPSQKIHSRYVRRLADLPWQGVAIRLELTVRRFFCINGGCQRKLFAEPLPSIVKGYARKTARLNDALTLIGFAIGGEAGARVARRLSMTSPVQTPCCVGCDKHIWLSAPLQKYWGWMIGHFAEANAMAPSSSI